MENSQKGAAWTALSLTPTDGRVDGRQVPAPCDEPSRFAHPHLLLTPVPEPRMPREPWQGAAGILVTGVGIMVIMAELGRRAGARARLTAVCSAGACALVIAPRLAPRAVAGRRERAGGSAVFRRRP